MREVFGFLLCLAIGGFGVTAADSDKSPIIITAPARLTPDVVWISLAISNADPNYKFALLPNPGGLGLQSNLLYTFTIVEEPAKPSSSKNELLIPQIARVEQDGKIIYDREVCRIHRIKMERKEVRIIYGLIRPRPEEPPPDIERRLFPHRREILLGGCIVDKDRTTENLYVCSDCKKAYAKWKADNIWF